MTIENSNSPLGQPAPTYSVLTEVSEFIALESDWNGFIDSERLTNPFITHEWMLSWWECFAEPGARLNIILAKANETLVGIIPLYMCPFGLGFNNYRFIGTGRSDFPDIITSKAFEEFVIKILVKFCREHFTFRSTLDLQEIRGKDRLALYESIFKSSGFYLLNRQKNVAPYIEFRDGGWNGYLENRDKKMRKALKKKEKRLLNKGNIVIQKHNKLDVEISNFANHLELASYIERRSWKFDNGTERINTSDDSKRFFSLIFERFSRRGWLDFWVYFREQEPKAYAINFRINDVVGAYNSAYIVDESEYGPGALMHIFRLRDAADGGVQNYSFLRGNEEYKYQWTSSEETLFQFISATSPLSPHRLYCYVRWKLAESERMVKFREVIVGGIQKMARR